MVVSEINTNFETGNNYFRESVFTTIEWADLFDGGLKRYGVFKKDALQAVFAVHTGRRFSLSVIQNPALTPHCGLVYAEQSGNNASMTSWRKEIMASVAAFVNRMPHALLSIGFPTWVTDLQPFAWLDCKVIAHYTYIIDLKNRSDDDIIAQMNKTRKSQIKNGHKKGLEVERCRDYSIIEKLIAQTFSRQKMGYQDKLVEKVLHQYAKGHNSFAFITRLHENPVAGCFCVHDHHRAYYLLGGFDHHNTLAAAGPMTMFACIRHARDLGLEQFDFEGSCVPGIERYFRSFGGTLTPMFRVVKASLPIEMVLKPFKRHLF